MNNLILRATTGAIYVALIVCSILFGGFWGFSLLCILFAMLATAEFEILCNGNKIGSNATLIIDLVTAFVVVVSPALLIMNSSGIFLCQLAILALLLLIRLTVQLYVTRTNALTSIQSSLSAILYISLPLALASTAYFLFGPTILLLMFIMIWLNDTGAYLVGSQIGRRRLFERISPKKSWEGFFGGMLFSIAAGVVAKLCFGDHFDAPMWAMCLYGACVSIFATWGDLVESLIKRTLGVKDSGKMMPGHGGILDRIDSLLFVAPMTFIFLICINYLS